MGAKETDWWYAEEFSNRQPVIFGLFWNSVKLCHYYTKTFLKQKPRLYIKPK